MSVLLKTLENTNKKERNNEYLFKCEILWTKVNLPLELSFTNEAKNAEKVAIMFKDYEWLKVCC